MKFNPVVKGLIIVFLVALFAVWPLLTPGFIPTHDGEYHLIRFFEFDKNIKAGEFFPRWAPGLNSGFGVPLFNFFYPLPNYVGEFFHVLGFSFIDSFKLTLALGLILSGLFFYFWAAEVWGVLTGVVSAVFYILAPYHLVDIYVRGSPGEVWALVWLPAVLWGFEKLIKTQKIVFLFLGSLFLAFLILSHNILAMIFILFIISYLFLLIWFQPRKKRLSAARSALYAFFLGLGLACFFWLPALAEAKYVTGLKFISFADHFPTFSQLLLPSWGAGFSVPGVSDSMSMQIGIPHLLMVLFAIFLLFRKRKKNFYLFFFLVWFFIVLIFLLEISLPLWKLIPIMPFIQHPWRLLSLMILITSALAAALTSQKKSRLLAVFLIVLTLAFYGGYTRPVKYLPRTDDFYLDNPVWTDGTNTLGDSFSTIWAPGKQPQRAEEKLAIIQGEGKVEKVFVKPTNYSFQIKTTTPAQLQVNTLYFPGWQVLANAKEIPINFDNGLINFSLPEGDHLVKVEFKETPVRNLANFISFLSLVFLIGTVTCLKRYNKKR